MMNEFKFSVSYKTHNFKLLLYIEFNSSQLFSSKVGISTDYKKIIEKKNCLLLDTYNFTISDLQHYNALNFLL